MLTQVLELLLDGFILTFLEHSVLMIVARLMCVKGRGRGGEAWGFQGEAGGGEKKPLKT